MTKERTLQGLKLNQEQNKKIIDLIRAKLNPLHTKMKVFPRIYKSDSHSTSFVKGKKSPADTFLMTRMISKGLGPYPKQLQNHSHQLLDKVRSHIAQKKKNSLSTYEKGDLDPFIQLFSEHNHNSDTQNKINFQLATMKKETVLNTFGSFRTIGDPRKVSHIEISQCSLVSPEEISLMNAKLRKKLNHKKMIDLHKIR